MIQVKALTKIYGQQRAIDAIDFEIGAGQIVGFLGPNGAGKTTTMKIITCFMPPTEGTVQVDELNIHDHSQEIRKRIGYLPEHNPLYLDMYVHEFLRFVGRLYQVPAAKLQHRVAEVIDMTGLGREQHKKIGMLSKGYRQRVGLCQALIHDPDILILDEPTTGLDPNQIVEIRSLIKEIGKSKTVIFSTHILPEVEAIADRVIIIHRGRIVADQTMDEVRGGNLETYTYQLQLEKPGFIMPQGANTPHLSPEGTSGKDWSFAIPAGSNLWRTVLEQCLAQDNPVIRLQKEEKSLAQLFRQVTKD